MGHSAMTVVKLLCGLLILEVVTAEDYQQETGLEELRIPDISTYIDNGIQEHQDENSIQNVLPEREKIPFQEYVMKRQIQKDGAMSSRNNNYVMLDYIGNRNFHPLLGTFISTFRSLFPHTRIQDMLDSMTRQREAGLWNATKSRIYHGDYMMPRKFSLRSKNEDKIKKRSLGMPSMPNYYKWKWMRSLKAKEDKKKIMDMINSILN